MSSSVPPIEIAGVPPAIRPEYMKDAINPGFEGYNFILGIKIIFMRVTLMQSDRAPSLLNALLSPS